MKLIIIAAVSVDGVIGIGDEIPWHIPEDFDHYRKTTMGNMLLVGATTFQTLPPKALEGRNFMILNNGEYIKGLPISSCYQFKQLDTVLELLGNGKNDFDKVYVIGGASVYETLLPYCDEAIITWVDKKFLLNNNIKRFPVYELFTNFTADKYTEWQKSKTGLRYKISKYVKNGS